MVTQEINSNISVTSTRYSENVSNIYTCIVYEQPVQEQHQANECDGCKDWCHRTFGTGCTAYCYAKARREEWELLLLVLVILIIQHFK